MTDLHTHILPGIDDGADSAEKSIAMLKMERDQGVKTVVLTPHFYRNRESLNSFLCRRADAVQVLEEAISKLPQEEQDSLPQRVLAAEVLWWPDMYEWEELSELCIGKTKNLLIELPFAKWSNHMVDQIYNLAGRTGITPVFAHLDRYFKAQPPRYIYDILELDFPVQIGTDAILSRFRRGRVMRFLNNGGGNLISSDCHDDKRRVANLKEAFDVLKLKLGEETVSDFIRCADELAGINSAK